MPIVGGLDIHWKQITFDYLDTATGEVKRGQIAPADRAHLHAWLTRFAGRDDAAFALEGCTGWRYVAEELAFAGIAAHVAEPADTAFARGRKRHAKTDKTDSRHLRELLAEGRSRNAGSRRHTSWNAGRCWSCITTCGPGTPPRRSCAVFFHQGALALGEAALRTGRDLQALRASAAAYLSPAGQLQVATALDVLAALDAQLEVVRHRLLDAARHLTGARVLAERLYGVGPATVRRRRAGRAAAERTGPAAHVHRTGGRAGEGAGVRAARGERDAAGEVELPGPRDRGPGHHGVYPGAHGTPLAGAGRAQAVAAPVLDLSPRPVFRGQGRPRVRPV